MIPGDVVSHRPKPLSCDPATTLTQLPQCLDEASPAIIAVTQDRRRDEVVRRLQGRAAVSVLSVLLAVRGQLMALTLALRSAAAFGRLRGDLDRFLFQQAKRVDGAGRAQAIGTDRRLDLQVLEALVLITTWSASSPPKFLMFMRWRMSWPR